MLAVATAEGLKVFLGVRGTGLASVDERASYVRLPGLLIAMGASLALNLVVQSFVLYIVTGALWGIGFSLRKVVRGKLSDPEGGPDWSEVFSAGAMGLGGFLAVVHGVFWPLSVPVFYLMGNSMGAE
jgi:hypothetical protein